MSKENAVIRELLTAQGKSLRGIPWNTYPCPRMQRKDWLCLNGDWSFSICGEDDRELTIRVPFCPESLLSGIHERIPLNARLVYSRTFEIPESWNGKRILLHFGAVDQKCEVQVNGEDAGYFVSGYLPFEVEITNLIHEGENRLVVLTEDPLDQREPWGKQRTDRGGMWYTPVSGIWQTVWMEPVPKDYIRDVVVTTDLSSAIIEVIGSSEGIVLFENREFPFHEGKATIQVPVPRPWSPEDPHLYPFTVIAGEDRVESYFALRTLSVRTIQGKKRLCLNEKPYFFHGLLDQGYWSDGIYTPASPECFDQDILAMKALGFNTLRKHIKVEPELFYYACDRLGMIVFQDMVNNGDYAYIRDTVLPTAGFQKRNDKRLHTDPKTRDNFRLNMLRTVTHLYSYPCICLWTIFNEGWGQFCADDMYQELRNIDSTRFIDATSGWFAQKRSDVESIHNYFRKLKLGKKDRPQLLSEYGGYVWKAGEHSANQEKTYGYKIFKTREDFVKALRALMETSLIPLARAGLCGAIYTQVSDVEDETNGILTYDRKVQKLFPEEFAAYGTELQKAVAGE